MPSPPDCICKHPDKPTGHFLHGVTCPRNREPLARRIAIATNDPGAVLPRLFVDRDYEYEDVASWSRRAVEHLLRSIAQHDPTALLGEPDSLHQEYAVHWHAETPGADHDPGIRNSQYGIWSVNNALTEGPSLIGQYGITWFTIEQREHRQYRNGSTWSGPWRRLQLPEYVWRTP